MNSLAIMIILSFCIVSPLHAERTLNVSLHFNNYQLPGTSIHLLYLLDTQASNTLNNLVTANQGQFRPWKISTSSGTVYHQCNINGASVYFQAWQECHKTGTTLIVPSKNSGEVFSNQNLAAANLYKSSAIFVVLCIPPFCKSPADILTQDLLSYSAQFYFIEGETQNQYLYCNKKLYALPQNVAIGHPDTYIKWRSCNRHHHAENALIVSFIPSHLAPTPELLTKCENNFQNLRPIPCLYEDIVVSNLASMYNFTPKYLDRSTSANWPNVWSSLRIITVVMAFDYFEMNLIAHNTLDYVLYRREPAVEHLIYCESEGQRFHRAKLSILVWFEPFTWDLWVTMFIIFGIGGMIQRGGLRLRLTGLFDTVARILLRQEIESKSKIMIVLSFGAIVLTTHYEMFLTSHEIIPDLPNIFQNLKVLVENDYKVIDLRPKGLVSPFEEFPYAFKNYEVLDKLNSTLIWIPSRAEKYFDTWKDATNNLQDLKYSVTVSEHHKDTMHFEMQRTASGVSKDKGIQCHVTPEVMCQKYRYWEFSKRFMFDMTQKLRELGAYGFETLWFRHGDTVQEMKRRKHELDLASLEARQYQNGHFDIEVTPRPVSIKSSVVGIFYGGLCLLFVSFLLFLWETKKLFYQVMDNHMCKLLRTGTPIISIPKE